MMTMIEIKAEVFKIIRTNQDLSPKKILNKLIEHLPDVPGDDIMHCIQELVETNND